MTSCFVPCCENWSDPVVLHPVSALIHCCALMSVMIFLGWYTLWKVWETLLCSVCTNLNSKPFKSGLSIRWKEKLLSENVCRTKPQRTTVSGSEHFCLAESFSVSQGKTSSSSSHSVKKQGQCRRSQLSVFSFLSHCFIFLSSASHFKLTSFYVIVTYHWEPDEGLPLHHGKCAPKGWGCALWHGAEFLYFRQFCTNVSVIALANDRNILRTYAPYSHGGHFPLTSHSGWGISTPASEETYFKVK